MKRRLLITAVACSVVALAACGRQASEESAQENAAPAVESSTSTVETASAPRVETPGVSDQPLQPAAHERLVTLKVSGMTCAGCASSISTALGEVDAVNDTRVSLDQGLVWVTVDAVSAPDAARLASVIEAEGYEASVEESTANVDG